MEMEMEEETRTAQPAPEVPSKPANPPENPNPSDRAEPPAPDARLAAEYPEAAERGKAGLPEDVARMCDTEGLSLREAYRLADLRRTKARCEELTERCRAAEENRRNARNSTGSLAGGEAVERDCCGPEEWDRLPPALRRKWIRSGRVFEFMKQWGRRG